MFRRTRRSSTPPHRPGDIIVFRKSEKGRPRAGIVHRVEAVDPATGTVRLRPDKRPRQRAESKPVDWQPARWGADVAEAFTEVAQEFRTGDRIQFTATTIAPTASADRRPRWSRSTLKARA